MWFIFCSHNIIEWKIKFSTNTCCSYAGVCYTSHQNVKSRFHCNWERRRQAGRSVDRHQSGCWSTALHFQCIHPFFNTHVFFSGSSYPSMHWLEGRETPWAGQQSIAGLTRTFAFTLTSTPRSKSVSSSPGKTVAPTGHKYKHMNKNAVCHFKQQQTHLLGR